MLTEENMQYTLDGAMIGRRIREARKKKNLTQDQLSERCRCTSTHICNIENGKIGISLSLLYNVSVVLEEQMDYFVMDCSGVNPQFKINKAIAPKLDQCDTEMLEIVDTMLDKLISYRTTITDKLLKSDDSISKLELYGNRKQESIFI